MCMTDLVLIRESWSAQYARTLGFAHSHHVDAQSHLLEELQRDTATYFRVEMISKGGGQLI